MLFSVRSVRFVVKLANCELRTANMKKIFEGKHINVFERDGWEYVERKSAKEAVAIIAVADGKLILTEQYRRPVDARVIDFGGGADQPGIEGAILL